MTIATVSELMSALAAAMIGGRGGGAPLAGWRSKAIARAIEP